MSSNKDVKIAPGAVVCVESKLKGIITVGTMTVIHPKASVIAEAGPVIIGENNIIEEQAVINHRAREGSEIENPIPLSIGMNNVFEVGCEIRAKAIGDHNVFEPKCYVGPDVEIGNGCIIGAGCHITVAEKLPDQTVITGLNCTRSVALDRPPGSDDLERQQDELTVLSEIFTQEEFSYHTTQAGVLAIFKSHIELPANFILSLSKESAKTEFPISYLPPIRLEAILSQGYPSHCPPELTVSCSWLGTQQLDSIVTELNRLWDENRCEILFIWCSYLKEQSLELLNLQSHYDLIEKYSLLLGKLNRKQDHRRKDKCHELNPKNGASSSKSESNNKYRNDCQRKRRYGPLLKKRSDERQVWYSRKYSKDIENLNSETIGNVSKANYDLLKTYQRENVSKLYFNLIDYNALKSIEQFKKNNQDCNVCFSQVIGDKCKQLPCSHVTCVECIKRMCEVHIRDGTVEEIVCSQENCNLEVPVSMIQELVPTELFDRYDKLMLNKTLDSLSNMTYCPRTMCQYPVTTQDGESLAVCPSCNHAFCVFCKRTYHGVEGCRLKSDEKQELIQLYQNCDHVKRLELEKRYGKKQLMDLVNAAQTEDWMSKNSKMCPCCRINIEKNDGCNKMICRKCKTNFCWLCLTRVSSLNPYLHFQDPKSKCFDLLFEGIYDDNEDSENEEEEENNENEEEEVNYELEEEREIDEEEGDFPYPDSDILGNYH